MSELENIVHHIVQHEEEQQAEKIKLESEIKALEEVLEHGISTKFVEDEVIYVYSPKTAHDMREKLEENYKQLHAHLTIPKSIADTLDIAIKGLTEFEDYLWAVDEFDVLVPYERAEYFRKWSNEEMNAHALAVSYVTGKALGVDLVKVVEG